MDSTAIAARVAVVELATLDRALAQQIVRYLQNKLGVTGQQEHLLAPRPERPGARCCSLDIMGRNDTEQTHDLAVIRGGLLTRLQATEFTTTEVAGAVERLRPEITARSGWPSARSLGRYFVRRDGRFIAGWVLRSRKDPQDQNQALEGGPHEVSAAAGCARSEDQRVGNPDRFWPD